MTFNCHLCIAKLSNLYDLFEHLWYKHRWKDGQHSTTVSNLLSQAHERKL